MGTNNLAARTDGQTVQSDDVNQYRNALIGDAVPRNASGSPQASQGNLGTASLPWQNVYFSGQLVQGGTALDFTAYASEAHQIVSGAVQTLSSFPAFITAVGGAATGRILGATTPLELVINTAAVTISSNLDVTGLTLAPSSSNTCTVDDTSLADQASSKTLGERGEALTVDAVGAEISALDGTVQAFQKGSEYLLARIDVGNNALYPFLRGVCRSSRETLADNDTLTLLSANWLFVEDDGATTHKTTIAPTWEDADPASPASNQWYFSLDTKRWRRYNGSWANMDAILLGLVVCDSVQAVAAHAADYDFRWSSDCIGRFEVVDDDTLRVIVGRLGVADERFYPADNGQTIALSSSGDRESGVSESASTRYYVYADEKLKLRFSTTAPRLPDRRGGMYHPREYWRALGYVENDGDSNLSLAVWNGGGDDYAPAPTPYPAGFVGGPPPSWTSAASVTIPAGLKCRDSGDAFNIVFAADAVVDLTASGANGLDTGSESGDKWYYLYALADSTGGNQPAGVLSETNEAASGSITLPAGYDKKAQLPIAFRNDAAGDLIACVVGSGWPGRPEILYNVGFSESTTPTTGTTQVLSAGTQTTYTDISLASFAPPISRQAMLRGYCSNYRGWLRQKGATHVGQMVGNSISTGALHFERVDVPTDASQAVQYKAGPSATMYVDVLGYVVTEIN